jgi:hypothetical protein
MKFVPRHSQIIGRIVIKRVMQTIIRPDETKDTTKFILIDAVGPEAEAAGLKVGDVIVPTALGNIALDGGACVRPVLEEKNAGFFVTEMDIEKELVVQDDTATRYVSFDDDAAAKSLGESPKPAEEKVAA